MNQSTGPLSREEFHGVDGVVLPNEKVGEMILTYFVDLREGVIFVMMEGGFESAYFKAKDKLYYIENINMVGVMLEDYISGLNQVCNLAKEDGMSPMPQYESVRNHLLTRAKEERSMNTN